MPFGGIQTPRFSMGVGCTAWPPRSSSLSPPPLFRRLRFRDRRATMSAVWSRRANRFGMETRCSTHTRAALMYIYTSAQHKTEPGALPPLAWNPTRRARHHRLHRSAIADLDNRRASSVGSTPAGAGSKDAATTIITTSITPWTRTTTATDDDGRRRCCLRPATAATAAGARRRRGAGLPAPAAGTAAADAEVCVHVWGCDIYKASRRPLSVSQSPHPTHPNTHGRISITTQPTARRRLQDHHHREL